MDVKNAVWETLVKARLLSRGNVNVFRRYYVKDLPMFQSELPTPMKKKVKQT